ncbi:kinase-like protein, partial [Schizopora paradoxa]
KEIKVWASLDHENVLPLLGYFTVENNKIPRLVSEWMQDGTMTDYMKMFPRCSFETQKMLFGIASGLAYLHDNCVIHGDLKTANVLISKDKFPLLTDFGLSTIIRQSQSTTQSASVNHLESAVRWMAVELLDCESHGEYTKETDVWAFGMVAYVISHSVVDLSLY